ncbi:MAG TPA: ATP-grasp domain-containing protein [Gemmatimonadales bacterium]|nr:ATP-grasp domain-containing protein [Gemmatimonadales bacterium]
MTAGVFVTDAEQHAALAVVRSLGRAGYLVYAGSSRRRALAGSSRYCRKHVTLPDPLTQPARFAAAVQRETQRRQIAVVLPITDAAMLALLPIRQQLAPAIIPFPELDIYQRVADKALVLEEARAVGFEVPEQMELARPGALLELGSLRFPLVLKPHRSVVATSDSARAVKLAVSQVADAAALERCLDTLPPEAFPVLLQQRIVGPGLGFFLLLWKQRRLAGFAHRRLLEKPPSGGVSVRCESVAAEPGLLDRAERLLTRLGWQGVAMVECKQDLATGRVYLMEVNGRFWGSLQLAIDSGVDFPTMLVRAAQGEPVASVADYRIGVRMRRWWGEVDHLVTRLRRSDRSLGVPPDVPGRATVLARVLLAPLAGVRGEVLRWDDPLPFLRETLAWFRRA